MSVLFPFTDLSNSKRRPALVLHIWKDDVILAFITSNLNSPGDDNIVIPKSNINNLQVDSLIVLQKIFTGNRSLIKGKIGKLEVEYYLEINEALKRVLFF